MTIAAKSPRAERARAVTAPFRDEYPFAPHFLDVDGGALHYVDEGPRDAAPILALHGNPTWSFFYRALIAEFSNEHRVVAPDHIGCGLSDKPQDWAYTLEAHIANVERLVLALDLKDITLVVHDWGGAIGMGFATRHPDRIRRLVVMNTAAFPADRIPFRIAVCRTPVLGRLAVQGLNAFAGAAVRMAVERPMKAAVKRGYLAPYDSFQNRIATWKFVMDIPMKPGHPSFETLAAIDRALPALRSLPMCIIWGERDWCFTPAFRAMWEERFPDADVHVVDDAGHYLLEDRPDKVLAVIRAFAGTR